MKAFGKLSKNGHIPTIDLLIAQIAAVSKLAACTPQWPVAWQAVLHQ